MIESIKNFFISSGATLLITALITILITFIKKGNFESYGIYVGKFLDKVGRSQFGTTNWEKIEDVITVAIISFSHGIKKGADWNDEEVKNLIENGTRNGVADEIK